DRQGPKTIAFAKVEILPIDQSGCLYWLAAFGTFDQDSGHGRADLDPNDTGPRPRDIVGLVERIWVAVI
ncbi:hypothetical protein AB9E28_34620, partial [Rhizobium leguminosarum]|uniref:hypothetical protein n=1 Tax=Rhizobium leguminosarum TaxID=384 RepID=UPI003F98C6FC